MAPFTANIFHSRKRGVIDTQGVYKPRSKESGTLLFCVICNITFFEGNPQSRLDRLRYIAASQIAAEHSRKLGHVIHSADPERIL